MKNINIMKRLKFYVKCIRIAWAARNERNNRQKWRRQARIYQTIAREMGLEDE
jgi:hypothetical protein